MKYKVWYNDEHGVLYIQALKTFTKEDVHECVAFAEKALDGKEHRYILALLSDSVAKPVDKEARQAFRQYADSLSYEKIAIVGVSNLTRMTAKIILTLIGKRDITRFFATEEEALAWLKGENR